MNVANRCSSAALAMAIALATCLAHAAPLAGADTAKAAPAPSVAVPMAVVFSAKRSTKVPPANALRNPLTRM